MSSINHPNIIRLLHVFQFCGGGNQASYICHHGKVQEKIAKSFMQQLGAGVEVLHFHHIINGDLKSENILHSGSMDGAVLKIDDFGRSRSVDPRKYA